MPETFIPLFSSTVRSSLWSLSGDCLKIFLTLALEAGPDGVVVASVDGIRRLTDIPIADVERHIATLEAPDPYSKDRGRNPKSNGRRLERLPNGWLVVNVEWYREEARRQAELFRKRKWWNDNRSPTRRDPRRTEREREREMEMEMEREMDPDREGSPEGSAPAAAAPTPAAPAAPKPKRRAKSTKVPLPEDLAPNASCLTLARERGVDLAEEMPQFIDHHTKNDSRFADWQAAIRTWVRNSKRFGGAIKGPSGGRSRNSDALDYAFELATKKG
jgi:pyruvate/2-oxoglutarate dehydrogenase complex dihydrolipoamide acyltransferase (E2) component